MHNRSIRMLIIVVSFAFVATSAQADLSTFNSSAPANNAATRANWLTAIGIANGADMVRVHDVWPTVRVCRMSDAIIRRGEVGD